jgi:hypothetical protein
MNKRLVTGFLLFFLFISSLPSITLKANGKWTLKLDWHDIPDGAGSMYDSTHESDQNEVRLTISKTVSTDSQWRLDVKRIDYSWNPALRIYIKRTSDGSGDGTIQNGLTYMEITEMDQYFFEGTGDRKQIDIQFKVEGLTIDIPPNDYTTEIYYTVIEV